MLALKLCLGEVPLLATFLNLATGKLLGLLCIQKQFHCVLHLMLVSICNNVLLSFEYLPVPLTE